MPPAWEPLWWTKVLDPLFLEMGGPQAETERHETAWIVARNRVGKRRDLFWVPVDEAEEKRGRVEAEIQEMPLAEWRERYRVPPEFVDPPPAGVLGSTLGGPSKP